MHFESHVVGAFKHSAIGFEGSYETKKSGPLPVQNYPLPNEDWRDLPLMAMTGAQFETAFSELEMLVHLADVPVH